MGDHGDGVDVPYSDWGDFRRRRAVDIYIFNYDSPTRIYTLSSSIFFIKDERYMLDIT